MLDDVADQPARVHPLGELRLDVVAARDLDAGQVGRGRRIDVRRDEVSLLDQFGDLRAGDE